MSAAWLALLLLAVSGSAHATYDYCFCDTLSDFSQKSVTTNWWTSTCSVSRATSVNILPGYTFSVGDDISGWPMGGSCQYVSSGTDLSDLADACNRKSSCDGFTLDYKTWPYAGLIVCYWSNMDYPTDWGTCSTHWLDQRCYGTWIKNTPPPCSSPPPPACRSPPPPCAASPPPPKAASPPPPCAASPPPPVASPPPPVYSPPPPVASPPPPVYSPPPPVASPPPPVYSPPPPVASPPPPVYSPPPPVYSPPPPVYSPPPPVYSPPPPVYSPPPPVASPPPPVVSDPCICEVAYAGQNASIATCNDCKRTRPDVGSLCCSCRKNIDDGTTNNCLNCLRTVQSVGDAPSCDQCNDHFPDFGTAKNGLVRCWECVTEANNAPAYVPGYSSKVDMCLNFCSMLPTPKWSGMNDPSECMDCVQHPTKDNTGAINGGALTFVQIGGTGDGQCPTGVFAPPPTVSAPPVSRRVLRRL